MLLCPDFLILPESILMIPRDLVPKESTYQAMKSHFISKAIPKYIVVLLASIIHKKEICFSRRCRLDQAQVNFARDSVFFYGNFPSSECRMSQEIQLVRTAYRDRGPGTGGPSLLLPVICTLRSHLFFLVSWFFPLALFLLQKVLKALLSNFFISPATRPIRAFRFWLWFGILYTYLIEINSTLALLAITRPDVSGRRKNQTV